MQGQCDEFMNRDETSKQIHGIPEDANGAKDSKLPTPGDEERKHIGKPAARVDAGDKISGSAIYIADLKFEGIFHCRTLRSVRPHARINSVTIPELTSL